MAAGCVPCVACGAKLKNRPGTCRKPACNNGSGRCVIHGGRSPSGIASPNFRSGAYSRLMPKGLRERYDAIAAAGPASLEGDLAVLTLRVETLCEQLATGDGTRVMKTLRSAWAEFTSARDALDAADGDAAREAAASRMRKAAGRVGDLIARGATAAQTWGELTRAIAAKRDAVAAHARAVAISHRAISIEEATLLAMSLYQAVARVVLDQPTRSAVNTEFKKILGGSIDLPRATVESG